MFFVVLLIILQSKVHFQLDYIDFQVISNNPKPFFGYSDLSTLLNAINTNGNIETYHYQLRHLIGKYSIEQKEYFLNSFIDVQIIYHKISLD